MSLTVKQRIWLLELWKVSQYQTSKSLSVQIDRPPTRVMKALEQKGLCKNVMDTFWEITDAGKEMATQIN